MQDIAARPLACRDLADVTIAPITRRGKGQKPSFGAYDRNGTLLPDFLRPLTDRWCVTGPAPATTIPRDDRCLYGGTIVGHYGLFLLESLARCWAFDQYPDVPIVWTRLQVGNSHERWSPWTTRLFDLLGVGADRIHIIEHGTRFRDIVLPEPGFQHLRSLHPTLAERLKVVGQVDSAPRGRVWLSRSALPDGFSHVVGEVLLEDMLRQAGWQVVHPEKLPLNEQIGLFHSAEVVAGFSTSAFHTVLLQKVPRSRLRIFVREAVPMSNYRIIAERLGIDQRFLRTGMQQLDERSARSSYRLENPAAAFQTLVESL